MNEDDIVIKIKAIHNCLRRAPNILNDVLKNAKKTGYLDSESALKIFNCYGMIPQDIFLLTHSHEIQIDLEGLLLLIYEQEERLKNSRQC